jgi:hypothetical protein
MFSELRFMLFCAKGKYGAGKPYLELSIILLMLSFALRMEISSDKVFLRPPGVDALSSNTKT